MYTRPKDSFISIISSMFHAIKFISLFGILILAMMPATKAATVDVTTEFIADLMQPNNNAFVNTTPISGFCIYFPSSCEPGEFSILIPGLEANKYFDALSDDLVKNHTSISLDGTTKNVILTEINKGTKITSKFRLAFFGMKHTRMETAEGHMYNAMTNTGARPSGGCSGRHGNGNSLTYDHGWGVPEKRLTCYRKLNLISPYFKGDVLIDHFSFGYTLTTQDPLSIPSGVYEGEVIYSVGEGGDIDFNAETTSDTEIRIKIKTIVQHAFYLHFAPGTENVSLAPKGGWRQWVNGGPVPDSLNKEVPFTLSSSSGFTVNMTCTIPSGTGCGLRNEDTGEEVPLEIALTLPGYKTASGSEVRNLLLNSSSDGHAIALPGEIVYQRRSQVDFRVRKPGVETMVKSPGSTWQGVVTLVFDAQTD